MAASYFNHLKGLVLSYSFQNFYLFPYMFTLWLQCYLETYLLLFNDI